MRIALIAQNGCLASTISSVIDVVAVAEIVRPDVDPSIPVLSLEVASATRRVTTTAGITVPATLTLGELDGFDVVVVPALGTLTPSDTEQALASGDGRAVVRALATIDPGRVRLAAACTGVFPLAETGLLNGRRVTTSWFLGTTFRKRYPTVEVDLDSMVVSDGPFLTAGAAFAHIDLALALVRRASPDLADRVARLLLIDERPSQAAYVAYGHLDHDDELVREFERYVRRHLDEPADVASAAAAIGTSRRTLERRIRDSLGMSPLELVQRLRLERARFLRRTTELSTEDIALRIGYANADTLRALERRWSSTTRRAPGTARDQASSGASRQSGDFNLT
jgi:transcriptional regulator GlxA family with amidase domain